MWRSKIKLCHRITKKRLIQNKLKIEYKFGRAGENIFNVERTVRGQQWTNGVYIIDDLYKLYTTLKRNIYLNNEKIFNDKEKGVLHLTITDLSNKTYTSYDYFICPNCNVPSRIKDLLDGCTYCKTKFTIQDLFPSITNWSMQDWNFMTNQLNSKINNIHKRIPYGYFRDNIINMIKILLFSSEENEVPFYIGEKIGDKYKNIINISYKNMIVNNNNSTENTFTYFVTIYLDVYIITNNLKIKKEKKALDVTVKIDLTKPLQKAFFVDTIKCDGCGSSFNIKKNKYCPYCKRINKYINEDWIIKNIVEIN